MPTTSSSEPGRAQEGAALTRHAARPSPSRRRGLEVWPPRPGSIRDGATSIGRSSARDIVLKSDDYAREATPSSPATEGSYVRGLGSTNGTFVNGRKTVGATPLRHGAAGRLDNLQVRGVVSRAMLFWNPSAPPTRERSARTTKTRCSSVRAATRPVRGRRRHRRLRSRGSGEPHRRRRAQRARARSLLRGAISEATAASSPPAGATSGSPGWGRPSAVRFGGTRDELAVARSRTSETRGRTCCAAGA